jgi:hypothetical protein
MREMQKLPVFRANQRRITISLGFALFLTAWQFGCLFKIKTTKIQPVPTAILNAKTASFDELLSLIDGYNKIAELSSGSLNLTLVRKISSEKSEQWRSAPGYILLKRPDSIHLALRSPMSTEFEMVSIHDDLSAWIPSKNKLYLGKNSAKELTYDGFTITMRGSHLFDAMLPQSLRTDSSEIRISMEEAADAESKYYIISFYKDSASSRIHTLRRIWIERSKMAMCRQQVFLEDGRVESDIEYSNIEKTKDWYLPLKIHLDRPLDGYALTMEFRSGSWRVNNGLTDDMFILPRPPGAEIIHLNENIKSGAP